MSFGSVVQLVRMLPCHGRGRGFESRPVRKKGYLAISSLFLVLAFPCINYPRPVLTTFIKEFHILYYSSKIIKSGCQFTDPGVYTFSFP